ncbi:MAG: GNAT family N-acetyltransferase [Candidatus Sericytochromatia bacterium]|nr:GNAT family N-acetyltransferase [Candidatus Sericytochromatia bacterium]
MPSQPPPRLVIHEPLTCRDGRQATLRRATPDDAEAIWQLYHRVYQGTYSMPIVNLRPQREEALRDPSCLWIVVDAGDGVLVSSVIFLLDAQERHAKVFAAATDPTWRRDGLAELSIRTGIARLMHETPRLCDAIYATTRTRTMGPDSLLRKLGFMSLGIFPNVHRTTHYETHGLKALFHPDAFAGRRQTPRLIPEVAGFYDIVRQSYGLEPAEIVPIADRLRLRVERGELVPEALNRCRERGELLLDFFPFHPPTHLFLAEHGQVKAFVNHDGKDGHGVLVALQVDRAEVQHLTHILDMVFETGRTVGIDYMEVLVSAHEPTHQRAALSANFLPCAYFPSMAQRGEHREDQLVFARSTLPLNFSNVQLTPRDRKFLDAYLMNTEFRNLVVQMQEPVVDADGGA